MNSRSAVIAVLVAFAMVLPAMPFLASDSDADTDVFDGYYGKQLTANQKKMYDAMIAAPDTITTAGDPETGYYIIVYVDGLVNETEHLKDAKIAWQATKLDASSSNYWAYWTWTLGNVTPTVSVVEATATATYCTLHISYPTQLDNQFVNAVQHVTDAINAIEITGSTTAEKIKNINSKLAGSPYVYVENNESHLYANTIYAIAAENVESEKVYMTSFAYSAVFKALCAKSEVACSQVYGFYGNESKIAAWNEVVIDSKVYGVDSAVNSTSGSDLWLAAGVYTMGNGDAFSKVHRAFVNNATQGFDYSAFTAESLNNNGYAWPQSTDIWAQITEYLPWVLVGIICLILAIALVIMARKGDI